MNEACKALADQPRREILQLLREKSRNAGEIAEHLAPFEPFEAIGSRA